MPRYYVSFGNFIEAPDKDAAYRQGLEAAGSTILAAHATECSACAEAAEGIAGPTLGVSITEVSETETQVYAVVGSEQFQTEVDPTTGIVHPRGGQ